MINGFGITIYGSAKKEPLTGEERIQAEAAGFEPCSHQVIKWAVFCYLPVVPLGTFRVLKVKRRFLSLNAPAYSMMPVPWDSSQVVRHYLVAYGMLLILVLSVVLSR
jgi:hypothetical protein